MLNLENVFIQFDAEGKYREATPFGNGHINDTYLVSSSDDEGNNYKYILQRINHQIFKNPEQVMENIVGVTSFLKKKNITYPTLMDEVGKSFDEYGVKYFPTTYVINKKGYLEGFVNGAISGEQLKNAINETLKKK